MSPKRLRPLKYPDTTATVLRPRTSTQSEDGDISIIDIADDEDIDIEEVPEEDNISILYESSRASITPTTSPTNITDPLPSVHGANRDGFAVMPPPTSSNSSSQGDVIPAPSHIPVILSFPRGPRALRVLQTASNTPVPFPPSHRAAVTLSPNIPHLARAIRDVETHPPSIQSSRGASVTLSLNIPPLARVFRDVELEAAVTLSPNIQVPLPSSSLAGAIRDVVTPPPNILNMTVDLTHSPMAAADVSEEDSPNEASPFSCPMCLLNLSQIKSSEGEMMSTVCGHIFCASCLSLGFRSNGRCPTCRKSLLSKDMHKIFL